MKTAAHRSLHLGLFILPWSLHRCLHLGLITKMIVQPAMLYGMETVSVTSSRVKKLEVTEMKICSLQMGMRPHTKETINDDIRERLKVENITERCWKARQVVWPLKEARPRTRQKKDSGDGTTWEKKKRKTEAEMDGLCQPRHESHRNDERRSP